MKENVILIGMPGSGKSTVGVILAKALGFQFIDTDLLISQQQHATLQTIINDRGLEAFLECEEQAGLSVQAHRCVIATGGSMALLARAMEHLRELGTVIYLDVALEELKHRVKNMKTRGIAAKPGDTLEMIYTERAPYYQKYSDIRVQIGEHADMEQVVETIVDRLKEMEDRT